MTSPTYGTCDQCGRSGPLAALVEDADAVAVVCRSCAWHAARWALRRLDRGPLVLMRWTRPEASAAV